MTAYPEKVDLEHVLRQMGPPGNGRSVRKQAAPEIAARPWRVVSADGTTNALDLPASEQSQKPIRDEPEPADQRFCRLPSLVASLSELPAGPTGGSIAMPSADSRLPHDLVASSEGDRPCEDQPDPAVSAPERVTVRLTETGVGSDSGRGRPELGSAAGSEGRSAAGSEGRSAAAASGACLPPPVRPRQSSLRRPDVDSQLTRVIGAWPTLPQGIKAAMLALLDSTKEDS